MGWVRAGNVTHLYLRLQGHDQHSVGQPQFYLELQIQGWETSHFLRNSIIHKAMLKTVGCAVLWPSSQANLDVPTGVCSVYSLLLVYSFPLLTT